MDRQRARIVQAAQMAAENFREAPGKTELWAELHNNFVQFGLTGFIYGAEVTSCLGHHTVYLLDSLKEGYVQAKQDGGALFTDEHLDAALSSTAPTLWSDTSLPQGNSEAAKNSRKIDIEFGIRTGVTIPMSFASGLASSALGAQTTEMTDTEFERFWQENRDAILVIANIFDIAMRRDHAAELLPLNRRELDCLHWLAAGLTRKQVAYRLQLTDRQIENCLDQVRAKLKAPTVARAMAIAAIFGLVCP